MNIFDLLNVCVKSKLWDMSYLKSFRRQFYDLQRPEDDKKKNFFVVIS